jgi:hypothetical protein
MVTVPVQIVRFVMKHQPNIVECVLTDTAGRRWHFLDKSAVFTSTPLNATSSYPQPGVIACEIVREWTDEGGRGRCIISTERPWDVEATSGETQFEVFSDQITTPVA